MRHNDKGFARFLKARVVGGNLADIGHYLVDDVCTNWAAMRWHQEAAEMCAHITRRAALVQRLFEATIAQYHSRAERCLGATARYSLSSPCERMCMWRV